MYHNSDPFSFRAARVSNKLTVLLTYLLNHLVAFACSIQDQNVNYYISHVTTT